ncbi:MAG: tetratricopeptide repeat protein [Legionellales bacterium]|nr:tetratricopeptide repeat protein [Legionellales bacterium]
MSEYITDHDRVDAIKRWWDNNGTALVVGIILGLILIFGWQYWQRYQLKRDTTASQAYQVLLTTSAHDDTAAYTQRAQAIIKTYPSLPYAALSSLLLARMQVDQKKYDLAYASDMWVVNHASDDSLKQIARVRAARVLLAMKKPDEALNLLSKMDDPNFAVLVDEVKGDIYVTQHNFAAARKAYLQAQQDAPDSEVLLPILELKLSSLPAS